MNMYFLNFKRKSIFNDPSLCNTN